MNRIYMGWDPREQLAYDVAEYSIKSRTEQVSIKPLKLSELPMLTRPVEYVDNKIWCPISKAPMATEFAISRFCIPFLTKEWALFVDCDIVCLADIKELFAMADNKYAVMVVKHNQETGGLTKMDGQIQTYYSRKNWSSVMLWNCSHPSNSNLTIEMLNTLPGRDLHAFCWLQDYEIGELPQEWNYLVDINKGDQIKIAHYTLGGPFTKDWQPKESDRIWNNEYKEFNNIPYIITNGITN